MNPGPQERVFKYLLQQEHNSHTQLSGEEERKLQDGLIKLANLDGTSAQGSSLISTNNTRKTKRKVKVQGSHTQKQKKREESG